MVVALSVTAFLQGILGAFHCIGMCGPLATLLPTKQGNPLTSQILYNISRSLSYGVVGGILGGIGWGLNLWVWKGFFAWFGGLLVILLGIQYILPNRFRIGRMDSVSWNPFGKFIHWIRNPSYPLLVPILLGLFSGLLPCGLLLPAYSLALLSGSPFDGFFIMVSFSLGTYPAMTAIGIFGKKISTLFQNQHAKVLVGILLISMGLYSIYHRSQIQEESPECKVNQEETQKEITLGRPFPNLCFS